MQMLVEFIKTRIPGCYEVNFAAQEDPRGMFVKVFDHSIFCQKRLEARFMETFYTVSGSNVLRGMHLQLPPADHAKLVYCVTGKVMDVVLDVRKGSPTYGAHAMIELDASLYNGVYLSRGLAHGFSVLRAPAVMVYHVTSAHAAHLDVGVAWDSFGARWPIESPLISPRDATLPPLDEFNSPFKYSPDVEVDG